jgi:hypothetical protein
MILHNEEVCDMKCRMSQWLEHVARIETHFEDGERTSEITLGACWFKLAQDLSRSEGFAIRILIILSGDYKLWSYSYSSCVQPFVMFTLSLSFSTQCFQAYLTCSFGCMNRQV